MLQVQGEKKMHDTQAPAEGGGGEETSQFSTWAPAHSCVSFSSGLAKGRC